MPYYIGIVLLLLNIPSLFSMKYTQEDQKQLIQAIHDENILRIQSLIRSNPYVENDPLTIAMTKKNPFIVTYLLEHGQPVNVDYNKLFLCAIIQKKYETGRILLEKYKVNPKTIHSIVIIPAVHDNEHNFVKLLLEKYNIPINSQEPKPSSKNTSVTGGETVLTAAVWTQQDAQWINYLINRGADVNIPNHKGFTPLMLAAYKGHEDIIDLLLDHDADPNMYSEEGKTACDYAATNIVKSKLGTLKMLCIDAIAKEKKDSIPPKSLKYLPENLQETIIIRQKLFESQ